MSAPQALELLKEEAVDLIITDFQMPEMDGLELLARVREMDPRLPVIMITGHASIQHAVRAMASGAVDWPAPRTS
jgi:DNA-binding NtrC family response regulator